MCEKIMALLGRILEGQTEMRTDVLEIKNDITEIKRIMRETISLEKIEPCIQTQTLS